MTNCIRPLRGVLGAALITAILASASGCGLDTAVGGEATGAVIFDRPESAPATERAAQRLSRLGRRLLDLARTSQQPVPLLWPDLHERPTLNGSD